MNASTKILKAAAGAAGGGSVTVDQVFSTFLYDANNTDQNSPGITQTIANEIDLTEGGLVWIKKRNNESRSNVLIDTLRGAANALISNTDGPSRTDSTGLDNGTGAAFTSTGFTVGDRSEVNSSNGNTTTAKFVSWTFRKADKFFLPTTVSHSNGSSTTVDLSSLGAVGWVTVKRTDGDGDWIVWHRSLTTGNNIKLNSNAAQTTSNAYLSVSGTTLTISSSTPTGSYVIYAWADNSSEDAADRLISCGSYTEGSSEQEISLGFEPQFLIVKTSTSTMGWRIFDTMRGFNYANVGTTVGASNANLEANSSNAESGSSPYFKPTPTGFLAPSGFFGSGTEYIFMAVRRDNQAEVTDATKVFAVDRANGSDNPCFVAGFPVDFGLLKEYNATGSFNSSSRLTSGKILSTNSNGAESSNGFYSFASNTSWFSLSLGSEYYSFMWKRAKSFFDVLAYSGTYPAPTLSHSLSTVPEMVVFKSRESCGADDWYTFHTSLGTSKYVALNSNAASTTRNSWITLSNSSVTGDPLVSQTGTNYIMYLFASLAGVSKVSSVVHSGTTNVDAGFSNGSRFILLKRTDASGDWLTYDSTRGIVSGNDPYLLLNSDAAQVTNTDYIDPYSAGFTLTSSLTAGTYIYYAIA